MGWLGACFLFPVHPYSPSKLGISLLERVSIAAGAEVGRLSIHAQVQLETFKHTVPIIPAIGNQAFSLVNYVFSHLAEKKGYSSAVPLQSPPRSAAPYGRVISLRLLPLHR